MSKYQSWAPIACWYAASASLLRSCALHTLPNNYRSLEINFGIVPYPKPDETQKDYITLVGDGCVFSVPVTAIDKMYKQLADPE